MSPPGSRFPGVGFDPVRFETRRADNTGAIVIASATYLAGPRFHHMHLTVGIRHDVIEILDEHGEPIVVFDRIYGPHRDTQIQVMSLLPALARKPGAWAHSPVRAQLPDPLRDWLDNDTTTTAARRQALTDLHLTATNTSYEATIDAAVRLLENGTDPTGASLDMLAHRIWAGNEPDPAPVDLGVYDQLSAPDPTLPAVTA